MTSVDRDILNLNNRASSMTDNGARFALRLDGEDVYFVNLTQGTLRSVEAGGVNFATFGDDLVTAEGRSRGHTNVGPGEAVRIGDYDFIFDSDFMSTYVFDIEHADGTREQISHIVGKREKPHGVIAWEHREPIRHEDGTPMTAAEAAERFLEAGGRPIDPSVPLNRADLVEDYANARLAHTGLSRKLIKRPTTTLIDFYDQEGNLVWRADTPQAGTDFLAALRKRL